MVERIELGSINEFVGVFMEIDGFDVIIVIRDVEMEENIITIGRANIEWKEGATEEDKKSDLKTLMEEHSKDEEFKESMVAVAQMTLEIMTKSYENQHNIIQ